MRLSTFLQKHWFYPALIIVLSFFYYFSYFNYGINLSDEGYVVEGGARVLRGQLPMSDFISYPPGCYFLLAAFFKLFGETLLVSRVMEMTFLIINGLLTFQVGKRLMPEKWALLPALMLVAFPGFWHKVWLTFSLLLPLVLLLRFLERRTTVRIIQLGLAVGFAMVFRIEAALFSLCTIVVVLFTYHLWRDGVFSFRREAMLDIFKELLYCGLALLCVLTSLLAYYHYQSDLVRFFTSLGEGYGVSNISWVDDYFEKPSLIVTLTKFRIGSLKNLFFFLTTALYLYFIVKVIRHFFVEKRKDFPLLLPVLTLGILSLIYSHIAFSKAHLLQIAPMSYVLFGLLIYSVWQKSGSIKSRMGLVILILLLGLHVMDSFKWGGYFASGSISRLYMTRKEGVRFISSHKARVYVGGKYFDAIDGVIRFFEGKQGHLMSLSFESMFNFLTGLDNPTRHTNLTPPLLQGAVKQKEVIGDIDKFKVKYLLITKPTWLDRGSMGFQTYAPLVYEYMLKNYKIEKEVGYFLIFSRN